MNVIYQSVQLARIPLKRTSSLFFKLLSLNIKKENNSRNQFETLILKSFPRKYSHPLGFISVRPVAYVLHECRNNCDDVEFLPLLENDLIDI